MISIGQNPTRLPKSTIEVAQTLAGSPPRGAQARRYVLCAKGVMTGCVASAGKLFVPLLALAREYFKAPGVMKLTSGTHVSQTSVEQAPIRRARQPESVV
ncbi:MAG: hypothetical protein JWL63_376 [Rhodocyclales bacterium]|nr:hypothetical protein [Rhodocyclales bacterium]